MAAQNPVKPKEIITSKFQQDPANIAFSFLKLQELIRFSNASKKARQLALQALPKATAKEMLHLVLNPEENNVKKLKEMIQKSLLDQKNNVENNSLSSCPVLIRAQGQEEYETEYEIKTNADGTKEKHELEKKQKVVKRSWKSISALEAAAWSGDNFLVNELLKCVPKHFYIEAISQLQRVLKEKLEHGEYLAPFKALIQSYNEYIKEYKEQEQNFPRNLKILGEIWVEKVGISQKNLSTYGLQEFCDQKPHEPGTSFEQEPFRNCKLDDGTAVKLSLLGSIYSLYKANWICCHCETRFISKGVSEADRAAIHHLCNVRTKELNDIIKSLVSSLEQENASSISNANARP